MDFDRASRHVWAARIVEQALPEGESVLDVGGSEGLTASHLPAHRVVVADVEARDRVDVIATGAALPFGEGAFGAVLALDVLEHLPVELRSGFLDELRRVADVLVVAAGPYATPGVAEAEAALRPFFRGLFDQPNPWLEEHERFGLPDLEETVEHLGETGWQVQTISSNPLPLWRELQRANFLAARLGGEETLVSLHEDLLERFLEAGDRQPPGYRHLVVASAGPLDLSSPPPNEPLDPWMEEVRRYQGLVVDGAMERLGRYEAELREGWEESARQLEQARRTSDVLETALLRFPAPWQPVAGPQVSERPERPRWPEPAAYQSWLKERAAIHPVPEEGPLVSILTPVYDPPAALLEQTIRSVRAQTYPSWELVLVNASTAPYVAPICRRFAQLDERVKVVTIENRGISENTNEGARLAAGEWLAFLDHDDELAPHALASVVEAVREDPEAEFVYSDEGKVDEEGTYADPFFKPDWSPDLLRTVNYIGHLVAVHRELFEGVGGLRREFDGAQDYDFNLRATHRSARVAHIPDILYHWRTHEASTAADVGIKPYAHAAGRRALEDLAISLGEGSWVDVGPGPTNHRYRYPVRSQRLSIVVPFRDRADLTDRCLAALARFPPDLPFEVVLVDNASQEPETARAIEEWEERYPWVWTLRDERPFNFQAINNRAARQTEGELLLFLNNDTEPLHPGWAEAMAEHAQRPEVGAVGARLFFPDGLVQHAGVVVGIGGFAEHPWARLHPAAWTPAGPSYWVRNFLAVTAACLMIRRPLFEEMEGFDERFTIGGGDVDLGLRLHEAGYRNVMTPFARLVHHESPSRGREVPESDLAESQRAYRRYLKEGDPFYNPHLGLADTTCSFDLD